MICCHHIGATSSKFNRVQFGLVRASLLGDCVRSPCSEVFQVSVRDNKEEEYRADLLAGLRGEAGHWWST